MGSGERKGEGGRMGKQLCESILLCVCQSLIRYQKEGMKGKGESMVNCVSMLREVCKT